MVPKFIFEEGIVRNELGYWLDLEGLRKQWPQLDSPNLLLACVYCDFQQRSHPEAVISGAGLVIGTYFDQALLPKNFANELSMEGEALLPRLKEFFKADEVDVNGVAVRKVSKKGSKK